MTLQPLILEDDAYALPVLVRQTGDIFGIGRARPSGAVRTRAIALRLSIRRYHVLDSKGSRFPCYYRAGDCAIKDPSSSWARHAPGGIDARPSDFAPGREVGEIQDLPVVASCGAI
jgi:hypothetical protein